MKKKNIFFLFSTLLLIVLITQAGCSHSSRDLTFEQDKQLYIIDKETATVSIFTPKGNLSKSIGTPGAGPPEGNNRIPLPPEIILFLLSGKGSISGQVWNDANGNRIIDDGEKGFQGSRVFIDNDNTGDFSFGDTESITDQNGFYTLSKVKPGTKEIYVELTSLPNGYGITTGNPIQVDLAKKQKLTGADFGIQDRSGFVNGTIWDQTDNVPMPGILVYLDHNNDSEHTIGEPYNITNSNGQYLIANLPGGTFKYNIDDESVNEKYYQPPGAGTSPTDITLAPGTNLTINRSYFHKSTISGVVRDGEGTPMGYIRLFIDLNGNGVYDAGEPVAVTDEFGNYIFSDLPPGTYKIIIPIPSGYNLIDSPGLITVTSGDNYEGAVFQSQALPVSINGFVWSDTNGNGLREQGEKGIADITIFLDENNNGSKEESEQSTVTDNSGTYSFTGLDHGSFYIRIDDSGLQDAYKPTTGANSVYKVISPGQIYTGANFGFQSNLAPVHTLNFPSRLSWGLDGNLYVSDYDNGAVFVYDDTLNVTGELKNLSRPLAVFADASGFIYVGNQDTKNVEVYDSLTGNLTRTIGNGSINLPNDIDSDSANNLYILDSENDTVVVFDQAGNPTGLTIGDSSRFNYAVSIAVNYRDDGSGAEVGELYVADQPNCKIHVFTLDGLYQKSLGGCGSLYTTNWDGKFAGLVAVDIDQYGYIHGLDNSLNVVQVFEPQNGTFVYSYNAYPVDNGALLNLQTDIAIHPADNRVIMSNVATQRVEIINTLTTP